MVVGLNGSSNVKGETHSMLEILASELNKLGIDFEIINVEEMLMDSKKPFCNNCSTPCNKSCFKGTKLEGAMDKITKADALVVASPVYFGTVSAQLKAFWDKTRSIRSEKKWVGKIGAAMATGHSLYGGQEMTLNTINTMLMVQGFTIITDGSSLGAGHFGVGACGKIYDDEQVKDRIKILAKRIEEELKKITIKD